MLLDYVKDSAVWGNTACEALAFNFWKGKKNQVWFPVELFLSSCLLSFLFLFLICPWFFPFPVLNFSPVRRHRALSLCYSFQSFKKCRKTLLRDGLIDVAILHRNVCFLHSPWLSIGVLWIGGGVLTNEPQSQCPSTAHSWTAGISISYPSSVTGGDEHGAGLHHRSPN